MTPVPQHRTKLFISYSHQDQVWLDRLKRHLEPLNREGLIDSWDDTRIRPGDNWRQEIRVALDAAKVAVLLVTADFFASKFIADNELPPLLAAAEGKGVKILSVLIGASRFERTPALSDFLAINSPQNLLEGMSKHEWDTVLNSLAETIESLLSPR
jgi:hypothetical protein